MSKRTLFRIAAAGMLSFVLRGSLLATVGEAAPDRAGSQQREQRAVLGYLPAQPVPDPQWAFLQGDAPPPQDRPRRRPAGPPRGVRPQARGFNGPAGRGPREGEGRPPFPPRLLERLRDMKPEDRERVLQRNPRFQQMSPERQAELLQRLNMLIDMNDDQRRELDRRLSVFRNLSPEQRRRAREIYENHWRVLAPGRRMAILEEFRSLRDLSIEERGQRIASEEYQNQFSAEERALLDELSGL